MILTVGTTGAQAQDSTRTDSSGAVASAPGLRALMDDAVTAYQSGSYARAVTLLQRVARRETGYISPEHGAAAYWRGQAHRAQRDTGAALAAYQRGLSVQGRVGSGSVRLAGTFLQMVLDSGRLGNEARAEAAAYAYRVLLGSTAQPLPEAQRRQADRQVALLGLLLPERVKQEEVFQKPAMWDQAPRTWTYRDGAGAQMLQWWRSQDPAPVTQKNERIIEHLRRVAYARQSYRYGQSPTRLDDRGKTYVRYGEPYYQHVVRYNDLQFARKMARLGTYIQSSDFPTAEVWSYQHIDQSGKYIFVEADEGNFRLGQTTDMLPKQLQRNFNPSERSQAHAFTALQALRYIYTELGLYYSAFGNLRERVATYLNAQQMMATFEENSPEEKVRAENRSLGEGPGEQELTTQGPDLEKPSTLAPRMLTLSEKHDREWARRRAERMPRQHTEVWANRNVSSLPVFVRTARFRTESGATRTEVYWGMAPGALAFSDTALARAKQAGLSSVGYSLLNVTAVQQGAAFERQAAKQDRYLLPRTESQEIGIFAPRTIEMPSTRGVYHLALQWGQRPTQVIGSPQADTSGAERELKTGPLVKANTYRVDTLTALTKAPGRLEMSDLKPMFVESSAALRRATDPMEVAQLYPYSNIGPDTPLLLSFEVYHPARDAGKSADYTIEYEVLRRTKRGALGQLFRGDKKRSTSTRTTYTTTQRRTSELILIDLEEWTAETEGELVITVRVTDEATGQTCERSIQFGMSTESVAAR